MDQVELEHVESCATTIARRGDIGVLPPW